MPRRMGLSLTSAHLDPDGNLIVGNVALPAVVVDDVREFFAGPAVVAELRSAANDVNEWRARGVGDGLRRLVARYLNDRAEAQARYYGFIPAPAPELFPGTLDALAGLTIRKES